MKQTLRIVLYRVLTRITCGEKPDVDVLPKT